MLKRLVLGVCAAALATAANATIINISATQNGEQSGNGVCPIADQPCNNGALINPVQVTFAAGTYTLVDAYSPATGYKPGALYDAWNFEAGNSVGWVWGYEAFKDDGAQGKTIDPGNFTANLLFDPNAPVVNRRSTEAAAATLGAATSSFTFTVATSTTIDFVLNDYYLPDNAGGISLDVERVGAVPEPGGWAMMLVGFGAVGGMARRRGPNVRSAAA